MQNIRMSMRAVGVAALALGAAAMIGCDKKDGADQPAGGNGPAATTATAASTVTIGKGILRGRVKYSGPAPVLKPVQRDCHPGGPKVIIPDETVLVSPAGELQNVIVFLKNPPSAGSLQLPPVIDQKDCIY